MSKRINIMSKKMIKTSIVIVLILVLWLTSLPLTIFANITNQFTGNEEEYIYYSDLFYGYSSYLNNWSLAEHHLKTQTAMSNVFGEYVESDAFGWAGFSETLNLFSSMSELAKAYTDQFGLTDFQYTDDLNDANRKFATHLFELNMNAGDGVSDIGKTSSQLSGVISTIEKLYEAKETDTIVLSESITLVLTDTVTYCEYTSKLIPSLNSYVLEYLDNISEPLDTASEIFGFASALATAIAMEDIRIALIEDILNNQDSDTILYEGMTKLCSQLKEGYKSYFVETYFTNKLIDEVIKGITKNVQNILLGSINAICTAVTSCIGLINDIVFDWILGDTFSSLEDYRVTMILSQYSDLLYDCVVNKQNEFKQAFDVSKISEYETLFNAYLASTKYALEQCANLAYYNNKYTSSYINEKIENHCDSYSYQNYVSNVKSVITSIPKNERDISVYEQWEVKQDVVFENGTDDIKNGYLYSINNVFKANIYTATSVVITVPKGRDICLQGSIYRSGGSGPSYLDVDGMFEVTGNIMYSSYGSVRIRMSDPEAVIKVGGDLLHESSQRGSDIIDGTIIFNGTTQQKVNYLKVKNLTIDNSAGIQYNSIISLYGHYKPNGNPIDNNGYYTYVYSGASFEDDEYQKLYIQENIELTNSFTADIYTAPDVVITVSKGRDICLHGSIYYSGASGSSYLDVDGKFEVTGDIMYGSYGSVRIRMSDPEAVIKVGGNLLHKGSRWGSEITDGTIIFNGTTQQKVNHLKVKNLTIDNSAGIQYDSIIYLYGRYKPNGNPIDNNGYYTYVYSEATFEDDEFQKLYIQENIELTNSFTADIYTAPDVVITVPKGRDICLHGSIYYSGASGFSYLDVDGKFEVTGDIMYGSWGSVRIRMSDPEAVIKVGGNLLHKDKRMGSEITDGTIIFNGTAQQNVNYLNASTIILHNLSEDGVSFDSTISSSVLFDHQGNQFTLYNSGIGSVFVDYDRDGLLDNVDPCPTKPDSCMNGHTYGEWKTNVEATPVSTGSKYKICSLCGNIVTEKISEIDELTFKGASLTLQHNLAINYKVDKALFDTVGYTEAYVIFEINGKKTIVKEYAIEEERYVFRFRNIAPNQMNDTIHATLYAKYNGVEYASETREYSVAEYCYSTLEKYATGEYAELRTLLVDLLHYGAQSQLYTNYNIKNLVNANLTEAQLLWGTAEDPTLANVLNIAYEVVENPLITWKGASLNLNESVSMKFKFAAKDIEGLTLKITSETNEWNISSNNFVLENNVYSVKFSGLNAGQMSEKVYLTMYKDNLAVSNTVCYSIESYAYSKKDSTIEYLADLVKVMMKYGNSAHSYVNGGR